MSHTEDLNECQSILASLQKAEFDVRGAATRLPIQAALQLQTNALGQAQQLVLAAVAAKDEAERKRLKQQAEEYEVRRM